MARLIVTNVVKIRFKDFMRFFVFCMVLGWIAACSFSQQRGKAMLPLEGLYKCVRHPEDGTRETTVTVGIHPVATGGILLQRKNLANQMLVPVNGVDPSLFAGQRFAWRGTGENGILTDVIQVATYECEYRAMNATRAR